MRGFIRSYSVPMTDEELRRENSRMREERECCVCRDKEVGVVFLPCGHLVSCTACATTSISITEAVWVFSISLSY